MCFCDIETGTGLSGFTLAGILAGVGGALMLISLTVGLVVLTRRDTPRLGIINASFDRFE